MEKYFVALLLAAFPAAVAGQTAAADAAAKRREELSAIEKKVESRKKELGELKKKEKDINRYISFLQKQEQEASKQQHRVSGQIADAHRQIADEEEKREAFSYASVRWARTAAAEFGRYSVLVNGSFPYYGSGELLSGVFIQSSIWQKASLIRLLRGESDRSGRQAAQWRETSGELVRRSKLLAQKDREIKARYEKNVADLSETKGRRQSTLREIAELNESARSLIRFLEKFEETKKSAGPRLKRAAGRLEIARNSLPWPAEGKLACRFGKEAVPSLNTSIMREGIKISVPSGTPAKAVADGDAIYAGPFRSYGNVVILDHGGDFFTVYGQLNSVSAVKGSRLAAGEPVGTTGEDPEAGAALYFEIRSGAAAVNPLDWLEAR